LVYDIKNNNKLINKYYYILHKITFIFLIQKTLYSYELIKKRKNNIDYL
jgi:hypothetical protein